MVIFLITMINCYYQSIYVLEKSWFFLFLDRDRVLNVIEKSLVVLVTQYPIFPTKLSIRVVDNGFILFYFIFLFIFLLFYFRFYLLFLLF